MKSDLMLEMIQKLMNRLDLSKPSQPLDRFTFKTSVDPLGQAVSNRFFDRDWKSQDPNVAFQLKSALFFFVRYTIGNKLLIKIINDDASV